MVVSTSLEELEGEKKRKNKTKNMCIAPAGVEFLPVVSCSPEVAVSSGTDTHGRCPCVLTLPRGSTWRRSPPAHPCPGFSIATSSPPRAPPPVWGGQRTLGGCSAPGAVPDPTLNREIPGPPLSRCPSSPRQAQATLGCSALDPPPSGKLQARSRRPRASFLPPPNVLASESNPARLERNPCRQGTPPHQA